MSDEPSGADVVFVESRLDPGELRRLVAAHFEDMVKYVVDVERGVAAVNIRPSHGNRSMVIEDESVRARVREITFALIGRGQPLE